VKNGDAEFRVVVDSPVRALKPQIADEIAWVAREAIVNAYKHSRARHIEAELVYAPTHFRCVVRDDGQGIDERLLKTGRDGHWGLTGMRERAERVGGTLLVRSGASAGTEIELSVKGATAYEGS
jgi:signal transduction histidine kinase